VVTRATAPRTRAGAAPGEPDQGRVGRVPVGAAEVYLYRLLSEIDAATLSETVLRPPAAQGAICWREGVAGFLERRYGWPVAYVEDLAVPGFHLFRYDHPGRHQGGGWHFDQLAWQVPYLAERPWLVRHIVNFTFPLVVPSGGTGMDITDTCSSGDATPADSPAVRRRPGRPGGRQPQRDAMTPSSLTQNRSPPGLNMARRGFAPAAEVMMLMFASRCTCHVADICVHVRFECAPS